MKGQPGVPCFSARRGGKIPLFKPKPAAQTDRHAADFFEGNWAGQSKSKTTKEDTPRMSPASQTVDDVSGYVSAGWLAFLRGAVKPVGRTHKERKDPQSCL